MTNASAPKRMVASTLVRERSRSAVRSAPTKTTTKSTFVTSRISSAPFIRHPPRPRRNKSRDSAIRRGDSAVSVNCGYRRGKAVVPSRVHRWPQRTQRRLYERRASPRADLPLKLERRTVPGLLLERVRNHRARVGEPVGRDELARAAEIVPVRGATGIDRRCAARGIDRSRGGRGTDRGFRGPRRAVRLKASELTESDAREADGDEDGDDCRQPERLQHGHGACGAQLARERDADADPGDPLDALRARQDEATAVERGDRGKRDE